MPRPRSGGTNLVETIGHRCKIQHSGPLGVAPPQRIGSDRHDGQLDRASPMSEIRASAEGEAAGHTR